MKKRIKDLISDIRSQIRGDKDRHFRERERAEYLLISEPCCGRTWLRIMIGQYLKCLFNFPESTNPHHLYAFSELSSSIPSIKAIHERFKNKLDYKYRKIILLVRDPREVIISRIYQMFREQQVKAEVNDKIDLNNLDDFLISSNYKMLYDYIKFLNNWAEHKDVPTKFILVRYEDLKVNTEEELQKIFIWLNILVDNELITKIVEFCSIKNMRKLEQEKKFAVGVFSKNENQLTKVGTRENKTYKTELMPETIQEIEKIINEDLSSYYGYNYWT